MSCLRARFTNKTVTFTHLISIHTQVLIESLLVMRIRVGLGLGETRVRRLSGYSGVLGLWGGVGMGRPGAHGTSGAPDVRGHIVQVLTRSEEVEREVMVISLPLRHKVELHQFSLATAFSPFLAAWNLLSFL